MGYFTSLKTLSRFSISLVFSMPFSSCNKPNLEKKLDGPAAPISAPLDSHSYKILTAPDNSKGVSSSPSLEFQPSEKPVAKPVAKRDTLEEYISKIEVKDHNIDEMFRTNSWGNMGFGTDPGETRSQKIADLGESVIPACIKYSRGNLSQRKTSMQVLYFLGRDKINSQPLTDIIVFTAINDSDYYVQNLANRSVRFNFTQETLMNYLGSKDNEERKLVMEPLSICATRDKKVLDTLEGIFKDKSEPRDVRLEAAVYSGISKITGIFDNVLSIIRDPGQPVELRNYFCSEGVSKALEAEFWSRISADALPAEDYKKLRDTLVQLTEDKDLGLKKSARDLLTKRVTHEYTVSSRLVSLYFNSARVCLDKNDLTKARQYVYSAVDLLKRLPEYAEDSKNSTSLNEGDKEWALSDGLFTWGARHLGGLHTNEIQNILSELARTEKDSSMQVEIKKIQDYIIANTKK